MDFVKWELHLMDAKFMVKVFQVAHNAHNKTHITLLRLINVLITAYRIAKYNYLTPFANIATLDTTLIYLVYAR